MEIDAPKIVAAGVIALLGLFAGRGCAMYDEHTKMCVRLESVENQVAIQWQKIEALENTVGGSE